MFKVKFKAQKIIIYFSKGGEDMSKNLNLEIAKKFLEDNLERFHKLDVNELIKSGCPLVIIELAICIGAKFDSIKCLYTAIEFAKDDIVEFVITKDKIKVRPLKKDDKLILEWCIECAIKTKDYKNWNKTIVILLKNGAFISVEALKLSKSIEGWDIQKVLLEYYLSQE